MIKLNYVRRNGLENFKLYIGEAKWGLADAGRRAVYGVGLRPLASWESEFESCRVHGCLSIVSVGCYACRGYCDGPITRPEEVYILCVCVCHWEWSGQQW